MRKLRAIKWISASLATMILLVFLAARLVQGPLRNYMETHMNESLDGYSVQLGAVDFQPIGLAVTLHDLRVIQDAHPDPPVADLPYLRASVHWAEIIHASLVADFELRRPRVHIFLKQLREEASDEKPVDERGWQDAVRAIYPLEVNQLTIREGDLTYIDEDPDRPLHMEAIFLTANNIQNVVSPESTYPSPVVMEATIFENGSIRMEGNADFLKEPYPGVDSKLEMTGVPLDYLRPVLSRYDFFIAGGELSATGEIEHSPNQKSYRFEEVNIRGLKIDYRIPGPASGEEEGAKKEAAKEAATKDPPEKAGKKEIVYLVKDLHATGDIGLVNTSTDPQYRVFVNGLDFQANRLSNGFSQGEARAELTGKFMGSGRTKADASFRPEENGPDFDMNIEIRETDLPAMNDMLRAYGNFDVAAGTFSLTSEIDVKNQRINGYIKPFFKDLDVYHPRQEEEKGFFNKLYEGLVGGMAELLENEPRKQVATRTNFSGKLKSPDASTWQTVINLIRNAYFDAILPGFEEEATAK